MTDDVLLDYFCCSGIAKRTAAAYDFVVPQGFRRAYDFVPAITAAQPPCERAVRQRLVELDALLDDEPPEPLPGEVNARFVIPLTAAACPTACKLAAQHCDSVAAVTLADKPARLVPAQGNVGVGFGNDAQLAEPLADPFFF